MIRTREIRLKKLEKLYPPETPKEKEWRQYQIATFGKTTRDMSDEELIEWAIKLQVEVPKEMISWFNHRKENAKTSGVEIPKY